MAAIAAIGIVVGLVTVRDAIVQEFGDVAVALDRLDQSYSVSVNNDCTAPGTPIWNVSYEDDTGIIDLPDDPGEAPACISFTGTFTDEGDLLTLPLGTIP